MGRKKSEFQIKNEIMPNTSVQQQAKSKSSKINHKKESEEMHSLMFLKDSKDKNEINGLDERIKLLKSELKQLLGDPKLEKTDFKCASGSECSLMSQNLLIDKYDKGKPSVLKEIEVEQSKKHSMKFSEWLDKTIDEISVKSEDQKEFSQCSNLLLNSKSLESLTPEKFCTIKSSSKFFSSASLSQDKVEKLLYQSFYLQNFEIYLSSSDENDADHIKSVRPLKLKKEKAKKSCKFYREKLNKYHRSHRRKKNKNLAKNSFINNVNPIPNVASQNNQASGIKNVEYIDLDVTNYDWSEPFEINDTSEFSSDVEIIESSEVKKMGVSNDIKRSNIGELEYDLNQTQSEVQANSGWECPICFAKSRGQEVVATQCGHVFCKNCLENHMSKFAKNCPTCRTDLTNKPPIILFNF